MSLLVYTLVMVCISVVYMNTVHVPAVSTMAMLWLIHF